LGKGKRGDPNCNGMRKCTPRTGGGDFKETKGEKDGGKG